MWGCSLLQRRCRRLLARFVFVFCKEYKEREIKGLTNTWRQFCKNRAQKFGSNITGFPPVHVFCLERMFFSGRRRAAGEFHLFKVTDRHGGAKLLFPERRNASQLQRVFQGFPLHIRRQQSVAANKRNIVPAALVEVWTPNLIKLNIRKAGKGTQCWCTEPNNQKDRKRGDATTGQPRYTNVTKTKIPFLPARVNSGPSKSAFENGQIFNSVFNLNLSQLNSMFSTALAKNRRRNPRKTKHT